MQPGVGPVGSVPVGGTTPVVVSGTYFNPAGPATATFSGNTPTIAGNVSIALVSQLTTETLLTSTSDAYVSQLTAETLLTSASNARVSQLTVEILAPVLQPPASSGNMFLVF